MKTIEQDGEEIELRRLTREEREARKFRRNLILFGVCGAILLIAWIVITYMGPL